MERILGGHAEREGEPHMSRKVVDCRDAPSEMNCTLMIEGEEEEVVRAAAEHAASVHGHADTPELRDEIRAGLRDAAPAPTG